MTTQKIRARFLTSFRVFSKFLVNRSPFRVRASQTKYPSTIVLVTFLKVYYLRKLLVRGEPRTNKRNVTRGGNVNLLIQKHIKQLARSNLTADTKGEDDHRWDQITGLPTLAEDEPAHGYQVHIKVA